MIRLFNLVGSILFGIPAVALIIVFLITVVISIIFLAIPAGFFAAVSDAFADDCKDEGLLEIVMDAFSIIDGKGRG